MKFRKDDDANQERWSQDAHHHRSVWHHEQQDRYEDEDPTIQQAPEQATSKGHEHLCGIRRQLPHSSPPYDARTDPTLHKRDDTVKRADRQFGATDSGAA